VSELSAVTNIGIVLLLFSDEKLPEVMAVAAPHLIAFSATSFCSLKRDTNKEGWHHIYSAGQTIGYMKPALYQICHGEGKF
jgi:hypothetical protein